MDDTSLVVAIDFGTTYIGYAFSPYKDCTKIFTTKIDGTKDRITNTVLLNPSDKLDSLGDKARERYIRLAENGQHDAWHLFEGYKTTLHTSHRLTRDLHICDVRGESKPALLVFSEVIKYLKADAEKSVNQAIKDLQAKNVKWVITVPAIWSDSAKQFMTEAADLAGIPRKHLSLVLEPEAASLFCVEQPVSNVSFHMRKSTRADFSQGQIYILADLGGGTADFSAHQVLEDDKIREVHRAVGEIAGGRDVNIAFEGFLCRLCGSDPWTKFTRDCPDEYLELMVDFERKKREFDYIGDSKHEQLEDVAIRLPPYITDVLREKKYDGRFRFVRDKLIMKPYVMQELFDETVQNIVERLKSLLQSMDDDTGHHASLLLLVGGFSESKYVRHRIESAFRNVKVTYPLDGGLAVMKGAVIMGFKPRRIVERRARYTYGFSGMAPFMKGRHPEDLKSVIDGVEKCTLVFKKVIEKGQILKCGEVFKYETQKSYKEQTRKQIIACACFYRSDKQDPKYCTPKEDCTQIATITRVPPRTGWPDNVEFEFQITVGETELSVAIRDRMSVVRG